MKRIIMIAALMAILSGCSKDKQDSGKLHILTTTGMIKDAVANIAGEKATVEALMGPGVDPHLYKASQGDLGKLRKADIIFYNGLLLEGKMGEVLDKLSRQKPVIAVADELPKNKLLASPQHKTAPDPHVWFDVQLWQQVVQVISNELQKADPANAEHYRKRTEEYLQQLEELHYWVKEEMASIPPNQRVLITAHDAFEYFGRQYNIEVRGLQGISTVSEYGLKDIINMVDFITERGIKAVFVESSVSEKALQAVVEGAEERGHNIKIGGTLYSDAMGADGTEEGTYIGMVRANVNTITSSLK